MAELIDQEPAKRTICIETDDAKITTFTFPDGQQYQRDIEKLLGWAIVEEAQGHSITLLWGDSDTRWVTSIQRNVWGKLEEVILIAKHSHAAQTLRSTETRPRACLSSDL